MRRVDKDGMVHDWEEIAEQKVDQNMIDGISQGGVTIFKYDSDDRFLLVAAADKLDVNVSFLLMTLRQLLANLKELEKKVPKGKSVNEKLLRIEPRYDPTIDPLPGVMQLLNVTERCAVPDRVGAIIDRFNELGIEARKLAGAPAEPPIRVPDYGDNPFLKVAPIEIEGVNVYITADIQASVIKEYKKNWFTGQERMFLDHMMKKHVAAGAGHLPPGLKVDALMKLLQDMANVMYGWNDKLLDNLPLADAMKELILLGAVNPTLPPPHLTQLGTFIRHVILSTNPGHLRLLRRLKTRS